MIFVLFIWNVKSNCVETSTIIQRDEVKPITTNSTTVTALSAVDETTVQPTDQISDIFGSVLEVPTLCRDGEILDKNNVCRRKLL